MSYIKRKKFINSTKGNIFKLIKYPLYPIIYSIFWIDKGIDYLDNKITEWRKSKLTNEKVAKKLLKYIADDLVNRNYRKVIITNAEHIEYDYRGFYYETMIDYSLRKLEHNRKFYNHMYRYLYEIKSKLKEKDLLMWNLEFTELIIKEIMNKGFKVTVLGEDREKRTWAYRNLINQVVISE